MKIFQCQKCANPVFFENNHCNNCGSALGFLDENGQLISITPYDTSWKILYSEYGDYKYCKNHKHNVCNWLIPIEKTFCKACSLNRTIPNLDDTENFDKWTRLEIAKHRLIFQLQQLKLPLKPKENFPVEGLCFDFLSKKDMNESNKGTMTGHANGVITILLAEADSVKREQLRKQLSEPYRTLIGHFRHEVGHYYWNVLVRNNQEVLSEFRSIFGDETQDYSESLNNYYKNGPQPNWQQNFISKYASSHPWEDWAETWAHYLHLIDMVETAYYHGVSVRPRESAPPTAALPHVALPLAAETMADPYALADFDEVIDLAVPLTFAVNGVNRAMGLSDVYPFVISAPVREKLGFIHALLRRRRGGGATA